MKPSTIILLIVNILFIFALLSACTPHLWNWTPLDFAHGGVILEGENKGDYDPNAYGSIVTEDLLKLTYFKFDKPYTDTYVVEVHCYDKDKKYIDFFVIDDTNYQTPYDSHMAFGGKYDHIDVKYYRIVLSYKDGKTFWSNWDLFTINFKFKFLTSEAQYNWLQRFFLDENFIGVDIGIWPFD